MNEKISKGIVIKNLFDAFILIALTVSIFMIGYETGKKESAEYWIKFGMHLQKEKDDENNTLQANLLGTQWQLNECVKRKGVK